MINKILKPFIEKLPENNTLERIWILAKIDFLKRYYGSSLGLVWALINPLFRLLVYYFVFTVFFGNTIENFALYLFSGLLTWMFFSEGTGNGIYILRSKRFLLENVKINKITIFISSVLSVLMGFVFNFGVYFIISLFFNVEYSWNILFFPLLIIELIFLVLSIKMLLAVINIYLKDINHLWDMATLLIFWANPIFYSKDILLEKAPFLPIINPLAGIMINTRSVILYNELPNMNLFLFNALVIIPLFIFSYMIFNRYSHKAIENM
jgi:ABC-type polysaccharide/polyol phosphate export permease